MTLFQSERMTRSFIQTKEVPEMDKLFQELKKQVRMDDALLVGRNMVNKEPGNYEYVSQFLNLLLDLAEKVAGSIEEKNRYVTQADITLSFFEENADLSIKMIEKISFYRAKINKLRESITDQEINLSALRVSKIENENNEQIEKLFGINEKINKAVNQEEFDKLLKEISIIDSKIQHDYLTEEQTGRYDDLNHKCTDNISKKMRELEYKRNVEYNKGAVAAFENAFKTFKKDEAKYKDPTQLYLLARTTLFAFDAAMLFNETMIYYNHVYTYIFNKLDEDGKVALTRFSIECERKQR